MKITLLAGSVTLGYFDAAALLVGVCVVWNWGTANDNAAELMRCLYG